MKPFRILIVEDEVIIADSISRSLTQKGHEVVGHAISFEEAEALYLQTNPDIVLLDIRLSGPKTGIDVAHFIRAQANPKPFIFLTSQIDAENINRAKETFPQGYLSKPIQKESLFASIEIAMHKYQAEREEEVMISLYDGAKNYLVPVKDILYLKAEHVYVQIHVLGRQCIMQRSPLKELLEKLPEAHFLQSHRSFAFNLKQVSRWDGEYVYIQDNAIPVSRSRRKEIFAKLV